MSRPSLSRTAVQCLRAVVSGTPVANTERIFLAFGELASESMIVAHKDDKGVLSWAASDAGREYLASVRHRHDFRDGDICSTCDAVRS